MTRVKTKSKILLYSFNIFYHIRDFPSPYPRPSEIGWARKNSKKPKKPPFFEKPHEVPWKIAKKPKKALNRLKPEKPQKTSKSEFWCIKGATKQRSFLSPPPHLIRL